MNAKRITFFVVVLILVSAAAVFANPKEGYYHNSSEEAIGITDLGNGTYYVVWFDRAGRQDFKAEARLSGNRLLYTLGGSNQYIQLNNNRNIINCSRKGEFRWSYSR